MQFRETAFLVALAATNIIGAFLAAVPIARGFVRLTAMPNRFPLFFAMLIGVYFLECVAFAWGMGTQILSVALSIEWGILFGLWLKGAAPTRQIIKQVLLIPLYGCLPTVSFAFILAASWAISGNGFLNVEQARQFGIPDFVPWPLNTILGFCIALIAGTTILKIVLTTGIAALIARERG
jgi:hypothetical protein